MSEIDLIPNDALEDAAFYSDLDQVQRLVEAGADINAVGRVWNPLHTAIENNQTEIVKYLLLAKADPNCPCNGGFSALHHVIDVETDGYQQTNASELPDATLTKLLVEAGADLDLSYDDQTPLQLAKERHHKYALWYLKGRRGV